MSTWFHRRRALFVPALALVFAAATLSTVQADQFTLTFEPATYHVGDINGQDGWVKTGAYDVAITDTATTSTLLSFPAFGSQALRMSNKVSSGSFGDQAFSKPLVDEAGETSATADGQHSGGTRQRYFEASFDFASAKPSGEQVGARVTVSPDRGDGARMAFVAIKDTPAGLAVDGNDYIATDTANTPDNRFQSVPDLATGLSRTTVHNLKITMEFYDGVQNDVVKYYVDGNLVHTGPSWEDYYRLAESNPTRPVDSLLFRMSSAPTDDLTNAGFFVDNLHLVSGTIPAIPNAFVRTDGDNLACNGTVDAPASATPNCSFKTVQKGVDSVVSGGTVNVGSGTFAGTDGQVDTTKSLVIKGSGRTGANATILDGQGTTSGVGIHFVAGTTGAAVRDLVVTRFGDHGIYADGPFTNFTVDNVESSSNGALVSSGRGIVVWNGLKNGVTITNNVTKNNALVGIGFQDGSATNVTISGNDVEGNGDDGIFALGLTGPGANIISSNTVVNNGRFGIDIALPNGNGAASGPGSVVVDGNIVSQTVSADALPASAANKLKDHAGILVMHRFDNVAAGNADQDNGVVIQNNVVSGIRANAAGTTGEGFGIVVSGTNMAIHNNVLSNNDVGVQAQQGNPNVDAQSTEYFDRDNAAAFTGVIELNDLQTSNTIGARGVGLVAVTDFSHNWWGNATGPTGAGNPGGTGSAVAGANVRFAPWLGDGTDTSPSVGFQPNATALRTGIIITPTSGLTTTEAGGTASFAIALTFAPASNVTIGLTSSNTSEGTVSPASVTFTPANFSTPQPVTVTGNAGAPFNGNVAYSVVTGAASSSDPAFSGVDSQDVAVTNTGSGAASVSVADVAQNEGDSGNPIMRFTATLSAALPGPVTVNYTTANGSAAAPIDFVAAGGTLTFAAGETSKTFDVLLVGDTNVEPDETYTVTLSSPSPGLTIARATATGTIRNDDVALAVQACSPRPRIVSTPTAGGGKLAVHVESSLRNTGETNPVSQIIFGQFLNAKVTLNGQTITSGQVVTLPANVTSVDFIVERVAAGQATTVSFTVNDTCGTFPTFVGGGAGAF
jgi:hypothetical protein